MGGALTEATTKSDNNDRDPMQIAIAEAEAVRGTTSPNPWVGAVVVDPDGGIARGATRPPGGAHAEVVALAAAGERARGATLFVTLEPCAHQGRTAPCVEAIVSAGVARVVVGIEDPDPQVSGAGLAALRRAGLQVEVGVLGAEITDQLAAYIKHRRSGRPFVVLKLACSLDGRIAAPDGSSRWITGPDARRDAHLLRSVSDAILVGAGTVRADDPSLTVRIDDLARDDSEDPAAKAHATQDLRQPQRVVLGRAPAGARVLPAWEMSGELGAVLDELGAKGVLQLLVEGGARVAHDFHAAGLVDRYVIYVAPAIFGGDDARPAFAGPGARSIDGIWRGRLVSVRQLGGDLRVELAGPDVGD